MADPYAAWRDLHCDRCGARADVDWVDVSSYADLAEGRTVEMPSGATCSAGCRDETGSMRVWPAPSPEELARRADRMFLDRHRRLADDSA